MSSSSVEVRGESPQVRTRVRVPVGPAEAEFVTFHGLSDDKEHVALIFGSAESQAEPLVRAHSECLTGDVFHSERCDCGPQLQESIRTFARQGGVILYLRQEGRGIGLYSKLDAYALQDRGRDTFEANRELGFDDDLRSFVPAAQMLQALGLNRIQLLTNNPDKVAQLKAQGIEVTQAVPTQAFISDHNRGYLEAKVLKAGHQIRL